MMTPKECAETWKTVIKCYDETINVNNPKITMKRIIDTIRVEKTKEVFATVAKIKQHDGRIYGENRKYMESITVNPECVEWKFGNPMIYTKLDHIHTAHINNLITELRKERENESKSI